MKKDLLKVSFLGGMDGVGDKNMAVVEYLDTAIILDCGNSLGVDLPGVNYEICDVSYLETIKDKLVGYVITHGHLDHMGGLKHIVPKYPAKIVGSRYTIGVIEKSFAEETDFIPQLITVNIDNHEQLRLGNMSVEFIRVTHSIPDASAICITTPLGRIIATGDFRLDPEPLDKQPTDLKRLLELGDQGVLLLLSESSYSEVEGRVPTESTLQQSFYDIINTAEGRIFVAAFSSNMNRTQMIINAAIQAGRKVMLDGRGMMSYAEIAVRQGILKIPKGLIVPISQVENIDPDKILIMCTGGQGEENAALMRMSQSLHKNVRLNKGDTVVVSSTPIPGNEVSYAKLGNDLSRIGVILFRHPTYELDCCGPLHVSGHAKREELREMIEMVRPKYFVPVHGDFLRRKYHAQLAKGLVDDSSVYLPSNGDSIIISDDSAAFGPNIPSGTIYINQNSAVVDKDIVDDRVILGNDGFLTVIVTISKASGHLVTSPDIISRGFIVMRDNQDLMNRLRTLIKQEVKRSKDKLATNQIQDRLADFIHKETGQKPQLSTIVNRV
jgi:ribonuclease J